MEIFSYAKAIAALLGAIVTAILGVIPESPLWLVIAGVVLTVVATFVVPNQGYVKVEQGKHEAE